jgi:hypothetical protein
MTDNELEAFAAGMGYENLRWINGNLCGLYRFLFTVGVVYGIGEVCYDGRFCFSNKLDAALFLAEWDGKSIPTVGEDACTAIK